MTEIQTNEYLEDIKDLLNSSSEENEKYKNVWKMLESLYSIDDIEVAFVHKYPVLITEQKEIALSFWFFLNDKIINIQKDFKKNNYFSVNEYKSPVIHKQITLSTDLEKEVILTLNLKSGQKFSWSSEDLWKFTNEYATFSGALLKIYKLY